MPSMDEDMLCLYEQTVSQRQTLCACLTTSPSQIAVSPSDAQHELCEARLRRPSLLLATSFEQNTVKITSAEFVVLVVLRQQLSLKSVHVSHACMQSIRCVSSGDEERLCKS